MTRSPQKAADKLWICRVGRKLAARYKRKILITTLKSPRVKKIIGKEISLRIGPTRALIIPKTAPAMKRSIYVPEKTKPGTSRSAAKIAAELAKMRIIRLIDLRIKLIVAYQIEKIYSTP